MKFKTLFSILFLCFVLISCTDDEEDFEDSVSNPESKSCITAFDCPDGYTCVDSMCKAQGSETDANQDSTDTASNTDTSDSGDSSENSDTDEIPDDVQGCPNACSGFGDCDFETKTCTCNQNHGGDDCSGCIDGYHLESDDLDEDGDPAVRSCVPNMTCDPNPCNGGTCTPQGDTVKCTCTNHATGTFCESCEENYLQSSKTNECKPDCEILSPTCEAENKKCGLDSLINEASCNDCAEFYSGEGCKSCDIAHFCNGHATACLVENGSPKCTCEAAYTGSDCTTCASGYMPKNGACVKSCTATQCFQEFTCQSVVFGDYGLEYSTPGHCNPSTCECDQGWKTLVSGTVEGDTVFCTDLMFGVPLDSRANVLCTVCDEDNPPYEYASTGCPTDCYANFCNGTDTANTNGSCYIEKGTHKVYCKCASGYTMTGGSQYYSENSTGQCE